jgi:mannitol-specific phosphotransferase system IIBC component
MEWNNLIDLILNSIQIIGVFIAIVIGLIISKVMDLKKEKNEVIDTIEDINNELENMNKQFDKLKEENYKFYKEDNVYSMIDLIYEGKECEISYSIPYISEQAQKDFYKYVKEYMLKVEEIIKNNVSIEKCKKNLKVEKYSVEEIIIDEVYERSE